MKRLTYEDNWGGGVFNFKPEEVFLKVLAVVNEDGDEVGTIVCYKEIARTGSDGHGGGWNNFDLYYAASTDKFERDSSLMKLLSKEQYKVYITER